MTTKDTAYWLNEAELKTPEHDKMVLWTFEHYKDFINPRIDLNDFEIERKIEYALGGIYNIGFIDLAVILDSGKRIRQYTAMEYIAFEKKYGGVKWLKENAINTTGKLGIFFEIKPKVMSIGEVLRQISYYRKYLPENHVFCLVTKTTGLKDIMESQGIHVIEYKEEENEQQNKS